MQIVGVCQRTECGNRRWAIGGAQFRRLGQRECRGLHGVDTRRVGRDGLRQRLTVDLSMISRYLRQARTA